MQISSNSQNSEMGVHKMTEHESGYFEEDDEEEDGSVKFIPQQIHERSEIVDLGSDSRGESGSESDGRNGSCFSPVCLEDDCWCFEGRTGEKGEVSFLFFLDFGVIPYQPCVMESLEFIPQAPYTFLLSFIKKMYKNPSFIFFLKISEEEKTLRLSWFLIKEINGT